jgi:hypothetical protein
MLSRDDYWQRKEDRDREWQAEQARNKPRIERQHSQHMAMLLVPLRWPNGIPEGVDVTGYIRDLTDWFQRDIGRSLAPPSDREHAERIIEHGMKFKHP